MVKTPKQIKPKSYKTADEAYDAIKSIYEANVAYLQESFRAYTHGTIPKEPVHAYYPYIEVVSKKARRKDSRLAYGFVPKPGEYSTTVTRPDIFEEYYKHQLELLIENHEIEITIGQSNTAIPVHFGLGEEFYVEGDLGEEQVRMLPDYFDVPDLDIMDDEIANSTYDLDDHGTRPLALFTAPRVDVSLQRLKHYTGTVPKHFQNYVILTNYQFYIDEFVELAQELMSPAQDVELKKQRSEYTSFVEPGNKVTLNQNITDHTETAEEGAKLSRMPQMPAYHLKRADGSGITMINIGVGPSNAKTITDHVAVLRPHAWLMLGHCAGLRNSQTLGDYVLAHGYLREDNILNDDLPPSIPIPALAEVQQALQEAVAQVTGLENYDLKKIMRTGTVATVDDRNWELRPTERQNKRLSQSRAIALDMESGTIAANGFRFRVPYGTLLCVSDKPLHGQLKLPGMADSFYRERVEQHLKIGLLTMQLLRNYDSEQLHSRKLRSFNEVAFQ